MLQGLLSTITNGDKSFERDKIRGGGKARKGQKKKKLQVQEAELQMQVQQTISNSKRGQDLRSNIVGNNNNNNPTLLSFVLLDLVTALGVFRVPLCLYISIPVYQYISGLATTQLRGCGPHPENNLEP